MIAPEIYRPYVVIENGKKVLYCEAQNVIYEQLKAALLFYKKLMKKLKLIGFILNTYYLCIVNKMVNRKQMTVV